MARGKAHSEETRAAVMAALLAGQSVSEVATAYKLPMQTVFEWSKGVDFGELRSKKGERIEELTFGYLEAILDSLRSQARIVGTTEYVIKQPASEIAVLHGVMADKGFRLLAAVPSAGLRATTDDADKAA